jgi:hypothetical protein
VDYDETLQAILGLMGRRVTVNVMVGGNPRLPGIAVLSGTLGGGTDLAHEADRQGWDLGGEDPFFFNFRELPSLNGFFFDRRRFVASRWRRDGPMPSLEISLVGGVDLVLLDESAHAGDPG